jgi:hypothetical protein
MRAPLRLLLRLPAVTALAALSIAVPLAGCSSSASTVVPDLDAALDTSTPADANDDAPDGASDAADTLAVIDAPDAPDAADAADVADAPDVAPTMPPFSTNLSEMGLYANLATKTLSSAVTEYAPNYALWSDSAEKRRWIWLPAGTKIDTSDMDHWQFPVGTRLFKEFIRDGKRIETRMVERTTATDTLLGTYVWNDTETEAVWTTGGVTNARGTQHDVPSVAVCGQCHNGEPGHVLGFSAVQLSRGPAATGVSLASIAAKGWLSVAPPAGASYAAPGDATTAKALGVLHANCGTCHNDQAIAYTQTDQVLRLYVGETTPQATRIWKTTIKAATQSFLSIPLRIAPGDPSHSAIYVRMSHRSPDPGPMPPVGTKIVDPDGLAAVNAWISALPP